MLTEQHMINLLTFYKFNLPLCSPQYEELKCQEILLDIEKLFLYNNHEIQFQKEQKGDYIFTRGTTQDCKIDIAFHKNDTNYFLPKFQFDLSVEKGFSRELLIGIMKIFESIGFHEYICVFQNKPNFLNSFECVTLTDLEKNFKSYSYIELEQFLSNTPKEYFEDKLKENQHIEKSFFYMLYICFVFYKNISQSENMQQEIDELLGGDTHQIYKGHLQLSQTKLSVLENMNIVYFKKYNAMLEQLFQVIKK
ncbi:MAG: hypothetical protein GY828_03305 [Candidatus Gracilibacteria bacterium]|nr:hypothetical protein [Candidatus Gracilibacteria bacterium]